MTIQRLDGVEEAQCFSATRNMRHSRAMGERLYYVHILASASRVLYTGVTNNLQRRVVEHKQKKVSGFTQKYNVTQLMHYEVFGDVRLVIAREKQIKAWRREKRVMLISEHNPHWRDLSEDWLTEKKKHLS
jgi:putative endonuclease